MKKIATLILFLFVILFNFQFGFSQGLAVTPNQTVQQLVTTLTGPGLIATNITGQMSPIANGIFVNNGVNGFSLTSGIILSTGGITLLPTGSGASVFSSFDNGMVGDADLDDIVIPQQTQDAAIIEFDFSAANDSVEFYFLFSSEEYNEYANSSFNDVFAFIINGPGFAPNTNVAIIPGTSVPISINTINNGYSTGTSTGPCMNCANYIDNVGTNAVDLCMDGFTTVIQIKFPIWPCSNYNFKIAIADVGDGIFDSAILMEENSFIPCPIMQGFRNGDAIADTLEICQGGSLTLTAPDGPQYNWSTGDTTKSITISQPGNYSFTISNFQGSCFAFSETIHVISAGVIQTPVIIQNTNILSAPALVPSAAITYQWYLNGIPIPGETQSTLLIPGNGCFTLTIFEGSCESISNIICITNTSLYELATNSIKIYPHPVTGTSIITTPFESGSISTIRLFDITGHEINVDSKQSGEQLIIEKGNLPAGLYFIEISNSAYAGTVMKKIMIN